MLSSVMGECQIILGDARQLEGLLVDKIVSSPPYSDMSMGGGLNTKPPREGHNDQSGRSPSTASQVGAGKYDKIITSPPFGEAHGKGDLGVGDKDRADLRDYSYLKSGTEGQIGDLPYGNVDKIIASPPYEGSVSASTGGERDQPSARQREERLKGKGYDPVKYQGGVGRNLEVDFQYSKDDNNIGNLKSQSYLEAMLLVYQQCFAVLKDGGLCILITKNFIREQKEIRLDLDTIKLMETAGFKFQERWYRELPAQSFWRVIYKKKYPLAPELKFEDVLVFQK